ncbi:ABC transporter ATP-binding protein [Nigerium massiliense]|uniref:ABC transporter ATP-binding protein n=1 Tax=Nigerium massiliense TaxID=1522317 RepID=UPI00058E076B|nr:ABC transporter ATP-binding protein [Nigerium massiliense]
MAPAIVLDDVTVTYPDAAAPALSHVSFAIEEGDLCVVVGRTGTGKSTLLGTLNGLVPHFTGGTLAGTVTVAGRTTRASRPRDLADAVGYVGQNPVTGFVTDNVSDEIAYGMEQLGLAPAAMRKRVEETLDLLGIAQLRHRPLLDLSGGQQQRVAIAAVLAAQPRVLILDEPTSALDPTAAQDVLGAITTLVHEVGLTVVLAEHRLERVIHAADTIAWVTPGGTVEVGDPGEILLRCDVTPPLADLARALGWPRVHRSVRDARRHVQRLELTPAAPHDPPVPAEPVGLHLGDLSVSYGRTRAVNGVTLDFAAGTVTGLMGRNGAGKSSLLWAVQGGVPSAGDVLADGTVDPRALPPADARRAVSLVPQTAADLLYLPTVARELEQADAETGAEPGTAAGMLARLRSALPPDADPRDLSEGQRLSLVLAIQLTASPSVVLLDEPTRGLDYAMKARLRGILRTLAAEGRTIVVSTHDVEFAASVADRLVVMADGDVIADGPTREIATSSPVFAPQVTKVFAPTPVLTVAEVAEGLR